MRFNTTDIYGHYTAHGGTQSWKTFRGVLSDFNQEVMNQIIKDGSILDMGSGLSTLSIIRIDRSFAAPRVNWAESFQLKKELIAEGRTPMSESDPDGVPWFVYYTDDWYCRFYWRKTNCKIRNKSAYRFDATRGLKGNKGKLIHHLNSDSLAHLNYEKAI